jgi:ribonuclease R
MHDESTQSLSGRRSRVAFHLAQTVTVRLSEARPVTGGLLFQMAMPGPASSDRAAGQHRGGRQSRARSP